MNPYMNYNPYNMAAYSTMPHTTQQSQPQTIQTLSQQSAQQQIYTYFVKSADQLNSIQPMPNTFYLGINADSDQIFVRHMNNDGVTEVKTYTLAGDILKDIAKIDSALSKACYYDSKNSASDDKTY